MPNNTAHLIESLKLDRGMPGVGGSIAGCGIHEMTGGEQTLGDWLDKIEKPGGYYLYDGGWGGPPGPVVIGWDRERHSFVNAGFFTSWRDRKLDDAFPPAP